MAQAQGYPPTVTDEHVLSTVLHRLVGAADGTTELRTVTVPDVVTALTEPDDQLWRGLRFARVPQLMGT